jgi:hypothetical protein
MDHLILDYMGYTAVSLCIAASTAAFLWISGGNRPLSPYIGLPLILGAIVVPFVIVVAKERAETIPAEEMDP